MDITPLLPKGRQVINGYGDMGFRVNGVRFEGSVLVRPDLTTTWPVTSIAALTLESLPIDGLAGIEILLIGGGSRGTVILPGLRRQYANHGIVLEVMDTGAACRTFNVLLVEERRVAAALIAVP